MRTKHLLSKLMLLLAVMLTGAGTAWAEEVTIASFSYSNSNSNEGWTITNPDDKGTGGGGYYILFSGASIVTPEIAWSNYSDITITISARKYNGPSSTEGKISVSQGTTELASYSPSGTSIAASSALSISPVDGTITISCPGASSSKGCGVQSIVIKGTEKASTPASPLASIALSGDYPTSFFVGNTFSHEGMTVTATYEDETTKDVTSKAEFSGYNMATVSNSQTVTVSYTEGDVTETASYQIEVKAVPTHTVTFSVNGETTTQDFEEGAAITFPANPADIEGKTFVGWVTDAIEGTTDEAPIFVTSAIMEDEDVTFYAVFAYASGSGSAEVTKSYGFETESDPDWTIDGPARTEGEGNTGSYAGKISTNNTYVTFNNKVKVKEFSFAFKRTSNNNNYNVYIETSEDNSTWTAVETYAMSSFNNGSYLTKTKEFDGTQELYVRFHCYNTTAVRYVDDVTIKYVSGGISYSDYSTTVAADTKLEPELSFSPTELNAIIGEEFTLPILNAAEGFNGTVEYTSSDESVARINDSETGDLMLLKEGTTTITATFAGNEDFKAGSASYTLTVTDNRMATTIIQEDIVLDVSEVAALTQLNPVVKDADGNVIEYEFSEFLSIVSFEQVSEDYVISSIDCNTGAITLSGEVGTATLKAYYNRFNDNTTYKPSECTFTITVADLNAPGTENNPYTVAQAIAATPTTGEVYISGVVSSFYNTSIVGDGSNYRYYISDDGTTATQLLVYRGKGLEQNDFTNADDLKVGDEVVIYGKLITYNNAPEIASGNYLVSWNRPVVTTPSISVTPATVNVNADEHEGTLNLAYANLTITDMTDFSIQYYNAEGEEVSEPDWIEVTVAEQDPAVGEGYVVSYYMIENKGEARTAYFKVYAMDDETNLVYSNLVTVSQAEYVETTSYTLAKTITSGKHYIIVGQKNEIYKAVGQQNANNRAAVEVTNNEGTISVASDAGVCEFVIYGPNASGNYTIFDESTDGGYLYAAQGTGTGNYMRTESDLDTDGNGIWSISINNEGVATIITSNKNIERNTMRYNSGSSCFSCYASGQQNIYLYEKVGEATPTETIHITDVKYATYCSENALDFENTGLTAYIAERYGSTAIKFTPVTKVPAYTGVLLKAENAGDVTVNATSSGDNVEENVFKGVTKETTINQIGIFVLMKGDWEDGQGVGFYKTTDSFTLGAHTAYLPASIVSGIGARSFIGLDFNDASGIDGIAAEKMLNGEVYNLQGQRMVAPQKGLYIVNGKKVVIK